MSISINGFGRIGRCVLSAYIRRRAYENKISIINVGKGDFDTYKYLFKYDSIHGTQEDVALENNKLILNDQYVNLIAELDPKKIDWNSLKVSTVLECSGAFTKKELAYQHITSGASRVLVSAPCTDADATIVYGVNHNTLKPEHKIISIGSCTTNCLAPIAKVLNDNLGIKQGLMTTVHAYTNDQVLQDGYHKDLRRGRAAALSMIPTSTGAAKAIGLVIPELNGKLDGVAIRVPVANVSLLELNFISEKTVKVDEVNAMIKAAAEDNLKGILKYNEDQIVSIDCNNSTYSAVFDATQTKVIGGNMVKVSAWYDNETGFSNRMLDVLSLL